jgi:heme-degrading monooxygenase HmoA
MSQKERNIITSINMFKVEDSFKQQKVIKMLIDATQQILVKHDGFISSRIQKSLDGMSIVSIVEWENKDSIEKMFNDPDAIIHMNDIAAMAKVDRSLYEIVFTEEKTSNTSQKKNKMTYNSYSLIIIKGIYKFE